MAVSPMRSIIRILADSSLVERIALDHDNGNVKIYYKENDKNVDAIRDMVDVINYYFEKEFNKKKALILTDKKEKEKEIIKLKTRKDYHLNTFVGPSSDIYRIDIHDAFVNNENYYDATSDIIDIELMCLEFAKEAIVTGLRKKSSPRKCVIEFNYINIQQEAHRNRYLDPLKKLPKTISQNIDISLVRMMPEDDIAAVNETLRHVRGVAGQTCLSVYFHKNIPLIERALNSEAENIYLTVDFKNIKEDSSIEELHSLIIEHKKSPNVFIIQYNIDREKKKMIGETSNTLKYSGREVIKRG